MKLFLTMMALIATTLFPIAAPAAGGGLFPNFYQDLNRVGSAMMSQLKSGDIAISSFYVLMSSRSLLGFEDQMNYLAVRASKKALQEQTKPALFTFFAGAGFLDLGFEKRGFDVVFVNENHKPFLEAYKHARQKMGIPRPMFGHLQDDISMLLEKNEADVLRDYVKRARRTHGVVGFVGGPPCPDFSVGGKNRGKDGDNGKLSKTYVDLICQQQPDFFVFENVKGLWRTKVHRAFYEELKEQLRESGYVLCDRLVNSIEFGAPQDRDRVILVGVQQRIAGEVEGLVEAGFDWDSSRKYDAKILKASYWPDRSRFVSSQVIERPTKVPHELTVQHWFEKNDVGKHPNAGDRFKPKAALPKFLRIDEGDDSKKCFKRLHRWRYSPTAAYGNNEVHLHPYEARRISVAEALSIQALPREFELPPGMTLTNKFKTIGNGVPYPLAYGIADSVMNFLDNHYATLNS